MLSPCAVEIVWIGMALRNFHSSSLLLLLLSLIIIAVFGFYFIFMIAYIALFSALLSRLTSLACGSA